MESLAGPDLALMISSARRRPRPAPRSPPAPAPPASASRPARRSSSRSAPATSPANRAVRRGHRVARPGGADGPAPFPPARHPLVSLPPSAFRRRRGARPPPARPCAACQQDPGRTRSDASVGATARSAAPSSADRLRRRVRSAPPRSTRRRCSASWRRAAPAPRPAAPSPSPARACGGGSLVRNVRAAADRRAVWPAPASPAAVRGGVAGRRPPHPAVYGRSPRPMDGTASGGAPRRAALPCAAPGAWPAAGIERC